MGKNRRSKKSAWKKPGKGAKQAKKPPEPKFQLSADRPFNYADGGHPIDPWQLEWNRTTQLRLAVESPKTEFAFAEGVFELKRMLNRSFRGLLNFSRQHIFAIRKGTVFFADFYFPQLGLVVELDGDTHNGDVAEQRDAERTGYIERWFGVKVLRFRNAEIRNASPFERAVLFIQTIEALNDPRHQSLVEDYRRNAEYYRDTSQKAG